MRSQLLKGGHSIAKPYAEMNVRMGTENGRIDGAHSGNRSVPQQDGIVSAIYRECDISGGSGSIGARAIVTPVGVIGGGIDKGKLELPVSVEGLPVLVYLAGVGDECGSSLHGYY